MDQEYPQKSRRCSFAAAGSIKRRVVAGSCNSFRDHPPTNVAETRVEWAGVDAGRCSSRGEERGDSASGTIRRGRNAIAGKTAIKTGVEDNVETSLPSQTLHDPPMLYRNGRTITRGFSRREFGQLCRRDQPPPSLSSSSRLRYHGIMHGVCSCLHFHAIQNSRKLRTGRNI